MLRIDNHLRIDITNEPVNCYRAKYSAPRRRTVLMKDEMFVEMFVLK